MDSPLSILLTALAVSGPTFCWVLAGVAARRLGWLSEQMVDAISQFGFRYALPFLLFASAAQLDLRRSGNVDHLFAAIVATGITVVLAWSYGVWRGFARRELGIFVQGAYRSNLAIVGIALCAAAFGESGLRLAALPIAVLTALYNVIAVWLLNTTLGSRQSAVTLILSMARNPLIIGIFLGLLVSALGVPLPALVPQLARGVSNYFLPIALLCIGGAMKLSLLRSAATLTREATIWRLCLAPVLAVLIGLAMGVRGEALGVLFLLLASPTAAASFVMVVAAGGNGGLAANIVVLTTLLSALTVTLGFFLLSLAHLV
ncbi:AEC family transporter [Congregibacter variabilis]|uniref:AEC family transporter n=1 Tax=Congregibacter variabilis TaxID=3081200 RepID=A0ABZ0I4Q9_9GAMM|nr:AEC family transporter [Congregibacter sp. IMCC43200]